MDERVVAVRRLGRNKGATAIINFYWGFLGLCYGFWFFALFGSWCTQRKEQKLVGVFYNFATMAKDFGAVFL